MILNGTLLYQTFGMSYKLCAVLWGTLAKHCLYNANIRRDDKQPSNSNYHDIDIYISFLETIPCQNICAFRQ